MTAMWRQASFKNWQGIQLLAPTYFYVPHNRTTGIEKLFESPVASDAPDAGHTGQGSPGAGSRETASGHGFTQSTSLSGTSPAHALATRNRKPSRRRQIWRTLGGFWGRIRSGQSGTGATSRRVHRGKIKKKIKRIPPHPPPSPESATEKKWRGMVEGRGGYSPDALSMGITLLFGSAAFISWSEMLSLAFCRVCVVNLA